jgi:hypothetical protein
MQTLEVAETQNNLKAKFVNVADESATSFWRTLGGLNALETNRSTVLTPTQAEWSGIFMESVFGGGQLVPNPVNGEQVSGLLPVITQFLA